MFAWLLGKQNPTWKSMFAEGDLEGAGGQKTQERDRSLQKDRLLVYTK